ncbi:elongin-B-like [Larus michahellis]|uniref:elongin-B-like n=1 Tax=Larus michahellis TaxID=119627 RepID=UPI003D9AC4CF
MAAGKTLPRWRRPGRPPFRDLTKMAAGGRGLRRAPAQNAAASPLPPTPADFRFRPRWLLGSRRSRRRRQREAEAMDVFLMIRRHKTTIFTEAKESSTVLELKRILEGILKRPPQEQRLYKDDQLLEDTKTLGDCGFTSQTARPQAPATVGLALRTTEEAFEALRIEPFSSPPELPDVMKPQDSSGGAQEPPLP